MKYIVIYKEGIFDSREMVCEKYTNENELINGITRFDYDILKDQQKKFFVLKIENEIVTYIKFKKKIEENIIYI